MIGIVKKNAIMMIGFALVADVLSNLNYGGGLARGAILLQHICQLSSNRFRSCLPQH